MKPPKTVDELRTNIRNEYDSLSKRLQQIAKYVLDEPNDFALETVAVLADRCGVQPSAIVRFAKSFGFDGASQMQRLFRDDLLAGHSSLGYSERIRQFKDKVGKAKVTGSVQILSELVDSNILALGHLREDVAPQELNKAIKLISDAESVYVVGFGRAFPIASYIAYALSRLNKRAIFIDGIGGFYHSQAQSVTSRDLMIAISFPPYSTETLETVASAAEQKCRIITVSDSQINPLATHASVAFTVKDGEVRQFRSLSVSMCLAQSIVLGYAFQNSTSAEAG
jgi:DNA-binding MurR/RpiR family transcriptional regulator